MIGWIPYLTFFKTKTMENITLGNLTLITGSNGSGKTRYLNSIRPDKGHELRYVRYGLDYNAMAEFGLYMNPYSRLMPFEDNTSFYPEPAWIKAMFPQYDDSRYYGNQGNGVKYGASMIQVLLASLPGDTVILENPELYLHPNAQSRLAELCVLVSNRGIRVVIETVSDHILNGILVGTIRHKLIAKDLIKVWYLSRDEDGYNATEVIVGDHGRIRNSPEGFFDQIAKDVRILLTGRNC